MPVTSDGYVVRVSRRNRQTPYETGIVSVTAFRSPKKNVHWTSPHTIVSSARHFVAKKR